MTEPEKKVIDMMQEIISHDREILFSERHLQIVVSALIRVVADQRDQLNSLTAYIRKMIPVF